MTTINFTFHPSMKSGVHPGRIRMRITHNRKSRSITLPYAVYPPEWDPSNRKVTTTSRTTLTRKNYLENITRKIEQYTHMIFSISSGLEDKGRYTADEVMSLFMSRINEDTLLNYAGQLAGELIGKRQERTAKAYMTVARGLVKFTEGGDLPLHHINARLTEEFEQHLKSRGNAPNTISYYMRNLRAIYNKAVQSQKIAAQAVNPFSRVYTGISKTRKRALRTEELNKLYNLDFKGLYRKCSGREESRELDKLHCSWRLFFFCLHARGMSFVDMAFLRKENIRGGVLTYYRRKTGGRIEVKVTGRMREIIESFERETEGSPYIFPIIRDDGTSPGLQYESGLNLQNRRLKKLGKLAGIKSVVSTHVARHTWASMCKFNNVPLWIISEGLGHNDEKTTYTYLASLDRSIIDNVNEMITDSIVKAGTGQDFSSHNKVPAPYSNLMDYMSRQRKAFP